jgi:hypothetical protein
MSFDHRLAELLDAATAAVPPGRLAAPLPAIRRRIRRRRTASALAVTGVVAILVVAAVFARPPTERATPPITGTPTPTSTVDLRTRVPWETALLARDGRTLTIYAGPRGGECQELTDGTAIVTREDGGQVTIAARARIAPVADCGLVVPLRVELPRPLGDREVRDAATDEARPTYREGDLPNLGNDDRWRPYPVGWSAPSDGWRAGYNGPNGLTLNIEGEPGATAGGDPSDAITLGSRIGTLVDLGYTWAVRWSVGDVTYELSVTPSEGQTLSRAAFVTEVNRLTWP